MFCQEVVAKTTDYLEGALPRDERSRWESHAATCRACARYFAQTLITIRLIAGTRSSSLEEVWPSIGHYK
jgi:anti-sigma factor RsiW